MNIYVSTHLIHEQEGKHLLIRRAGTKYFPGYLSLVAGHVELGETPMQALVREVSEEIGVQLALPDIVFAKVVYRRLSDRVYVDYFFRVDRLPQIPSIQEPDKISEMSYFDLASVEDRVVPYVMAALADSEPYLTFDETVAVD